MYLDTINHFVAL